MNLSPGPEVQKISIFLTGLNPFSTSDGAYAVLIVGWACN